MRRHRAALAQLAQRELQVQAAQEVAQRGPLVQLALADLPVSRERLGQSEPRESRGQPVQRDRQEPRDPRGLLERRDRQGLAALQALLVQRELRGRLALLERVDRRGHQGPLAQPAHQVQERQSPKQTWPTCKRISRHSRAEGLFLSRKFIPAH